MGKIKTHSGAKKRLRAMSGSRVKRKQAGRRHLLKAKNHKRKRHLARGVMVEGFQLDHARQLLVMGGNHGAR